VKCTPPVSFPKKLVSYVPNASMSFLSRGTGSFIIPVIFV
jgi:hypothetical protein